MYDTTLYTGRMRTSTKWALFLSVAVADTVDCRRSSVALDHHRDVLSLSRVGSGRVRTPGFAGATRPRRGGHADPAAAAAVDPTRGKSDSIDTSFFKFKSLFLYKISGGFLSFSTLSSARSVRRCVCGVSLVAACHCFGALLSISYSSCRAARATRQLHVPGRFRAVRVSRAARFVLDAVVL